MVFLCFQPSKMYSETNLTKDFRRVAKAIKAETEGANYRPDLTSGKCCEMPAFMVVIWLVP